MVGEERNSQILVNLSVNNVRRYSVSNAKTLGLKHLQFPDTIASGEPPHGTSVVHHRMEELFVQNSISDGQTTSSV